jgi:REP element-mobilizing transposase RayT
MANTYYQCYGHIIFAVKHRDSQISESIRERVQQYICGIIDQDKCKAIAIYCNPDHTHILVGIRPSISISDLVRDIKSVSSKFINEKKLTKCRFQWQDGYGVFTCSHSHLTRVSDYIFNQPIHHQNQNFQTEYYQFLEKFEIEYDERYLFDWL